MTNISLDHSTLNDPFVPLGTQTSLPSVLPSRLTSQLVEELGQPISLGTSIMACVFDGGVVMGADSRTTTGSYIANRVSDKITPVYAPRIWCCRSGSAADTQAISDIVRYQLNLLASSQGTVSVREAACLFRTICYKYRDQLQAGIILAGVEENGQGQVYNIPLGGSLHPTPFAIGGSGSTYIYGYCDANWKPGMTRSEAEEFVKTSLALAMSRDGSSGGIIRIAVITKEGVERKVFSGAVPSSFYQD
jgi:20S proteasome subunit beta 1